MACFIVRKPKELTCTKPGVSTHVVFFIVQLSQDDVCDEYGILIVVIESNDMSRII
jgi:hypothetical protein